MSADFTLSNIDGICQAVTAQLAAQGVRALCELGTEASAALASPPRLVWIPGDAKYEPISRQPADGHAVCQRAQRWMVRIVGSSYTVAESLELSLATALSFLFGAEWFGYKPISTKPAPDLATATSFALEHTLELRVPVYDKVWIHATRPLSGQANGSVTPDGTTTEPLS